MDYNTVINETEKYYLPVFGRYPLVIEHGKGCKLYDANGEEYLDFLAGIAVNALGRLHRYTVFSNDVGIVSHHFIPELIECIISVHNFIIDGSECSECITREDSAFILEPCDHCFRPVDHWNHVET